MTNLQEIKTPSIHALMTGADGGQQVLLIGLKAAYQQKPQYQRYLKQQFDRRSKLDHPNLLKYLGMRDVEGFGACVEMEWPACRGLTQWLGEGHTADERRRVVREVAAALGYLHGNGLVMGDLNPDKILLTAKGDQVKVVNFSERYADNLSEPLQHMRFRAPEAKDGTVGVDARADVYSLGVLLRVMGFLPDMKDVIDRATRFGRNERYRDVDEFLEAFDHHRYARPAADELGGNAIGTANNRKLAVIAAIVGALAIIGAVLIFSPSAGGRQPATPPAAQPADTAARAAEATGPDGEAAAAGQSPDDYLDQMVPQMQADLDKIYARGGDAAAVHARVARYYRGLRATLRAHGFTQKQYDAFDQAFSEYNKSKQPQ